VPANGREDPIQCGFYGKCHRKYTAPHGVRVKRCGKSAPRTEQSGRQGKPHAEQDQIGEEEWPAPLDSRVGCWSRSVMAGLEEWLPPVRVQKPAYSPASCFNLVWSSGMERQDHPSPLPFVLEFVLVIAFPLIGYLKIQVTGHRFIS
jgi:hypothetical protein